MPIRSSREAYNKYMCDYQKKRWKKRRAAAVVSLGGACVQCGATAALQFDHIDPSTRECSIARASGFSEERFQAELAKCQLLCKECHDEKSLQEFRAKPKEAKTCTCGKTFPSHEAYAGHRRWCSLA